MATIYRTLLIGLGAQGRRIVEQVWQELKNRSDLPEAKIPYVKPLVIDTLGIGEILPSDSYVDIQTSGMQAFLQSINDEQLISQFDLPEGVDIKSYGTSNSQDFASTRLGAHLLFAREKWRVARALELHLSRLLQDDEWVWAKESGYQPALDNTVMIYILAAIDEVSSGGYLPDLLELLPELPFFQEGNRRYYSTGVLTCFSSLGNDMAAANGYATLVEINGLFANQLSRIMEDPYDPRKLGTNYACYLLERVDERGNPLLSPEEGEALVVSYLVNTLSRPVPLPALGEGILIYYEQVLKHQSTPPELPLFSSFTQIDYSVPLDMLERYLSAKVGQWMVSSQGLAEELKDETIIDLEKEIDGFFLQHNLTPNSLVGSPEHLYFPSRVALETNDQDQALRVVQPEDVTIDRQALGFAYQRIQERERNRQDLWAEYKEKAKINLKRRALDESIYVIHRQVEDLINYRERLDGLGRSQKFLDLAKSQMSDWLDHLQRGYERIQQQAMYAREITVQQEPRAQKAIENRPSFAVVLARLCMVCFIGLLTWLILAAWRFPDLNPQFWYAMPLPPLLTEAIRNLGDNISSWLRLGLRLLHGLLFLVFLPGRFFLITIGLLGLRFVIDGWLGSYQLKRQGHNVPNWEQLIFLSVWPALAFVVPMLLAFRYMLSKEIPFLSLFPSIAPRLMVAGAGIAALLALVIYGWWFYKDMENIRHTILEWVDVLQTFAKVEAYTFRHELSIEFYKEILSRLDEEIRQLAGYRQQLHILEDQLNKEQQDTLDVLIHSEHRFHRLATSNREHLEQIYQSQLVCNPDLTPRAWLKGLEPNLLDWFGWSVDREIASLKQFAIARIMDIWRGRNLVTLLLPESSGNSVLLREALLPRLNFVREYAPQWSLYSQSGEMQVFAGVGDEENRALNGALHGMGMVSFQAPPVVYETGDPYSLTVTLIRNGRALAELEEIFDYREKYYKYPGWMIHTRRSNLLDPISTARSRLRASRQALPEPPSDKKVQKRGAEKPTLNEDVARIRLGLGLEALPEEIRMRHKECLKILENAWQTLSDKPQRYRHQIAIERGQQVAMNYFDRLGLPVDRSLNQKEISIAYDRRKNELDEALDLLLRSESTQIKQKIIEEKK